ncbi:MAG: TolC family protein [Deltaproteobacteria bacterium]|nr:TolC family protein [Deltaproteobacteria bacterium]
MLRVTFFLLFSYGCCPLYALTIAEIPALIRTHNRDTLAAKAESEAAAEGVIAARARHYPSLDVKTSYFHLGQDIQLKFPPVTVTLPVTGVGLTFDLPSLEIQKRDVVLSHAMLTIPLFAGGRIQAGVEAAKAQKDEMSAMQSKVTEEKIVEALQRYFGTQFAHEIVAILVQMRENLVRVQGISESMVRTGLGAKFSVLQIRVAMAELDSRLAEARGKAELADLAFKTSVGKSSASSIQYETPLVKTALPARVDLFKAQAMKNRREFAVLKAKARQIQALKAVHTGELLPTVYAAGAYRLYSSSELLLQPNWGVGVVMEIPLSAWLVSWPQRQKALKLEEKVDILTAKANEEIPLEVEKIHTEAKAIDAVYRAAEEGVNMAREALRLAEIRYKQGSGSSLEVLTSATELEKLEIQKAGRIEEFNRKIVDLYFASGEVELYVEAYQNFLASTKK